MKLAAALVLISTSVMAQAPQVPHKMQFAGITLTIRDDARREIQKDVDMLTQSEKHFTIKAERAKTYFPIIEKVFEEERLPDDFKYLVLQESALISDAVSVSNAVGFWQFKDFTALEMGLRVDKEIDERMNIEASSRAAAKYLKKNNLYFNNWIYALQAYQMGAGGVMQTVKDFESGTKHMEITSKTYWYVKKFLAHKIAYEGAVKGGGEVQVLTVINQSKKSMSELAREFALPEEELKAYNKWVRTNYIPGDRPYTVFIPTAGNNRALEQAVAKSVKTTKLYEQPARVEAKPAIAKVETRNVNGILAMLARENETSATFAKRAQVDLAYFLKCNDLSISDALIAGDYYYLKRKKTRADVPQHVVMSGENLWNISQKYGIQLQKLKRFNSIENGSSVREGTVLYLAGKPRKTSQVNPAEVAQVQVGDTFSWTIQPETTPAPQPILVASSSTGITPDNVNTEEVNQAQSATTIVDETPALLRIEVSPDWHTVSAGETLYSIARRYQLGVMDLVALNNLKLQDGIKPGQVLKLKEGEEQPQAPSEKTDSGGEAIVTHRVKPSDTLYSVAREYGVTIKELMDWNKKKDFSLTVGENLRIVKKQ
jgi:membrane-bound lytic murein transglycosylase D